MNVVIFGASGMVGQGVLRECLLDPEVKRVVTVGRTSSGQQHPKVRDLVHADLFDLTALEPELTGLDGCFFCLGVSAAGMSEGAYSRVTYDLTISVAEMLLRLSPGMTFLYVSGAGTDSTERGRTMWARVKGRTENALLRMPFKAAYMFRPAGIRPLHGIRSKTKLYQTFYTLLRPVLPLMTRLFPSFMTTTEQLGRAMLNVVKRGERSRVIEAAEINKL